MKPQRVGRSPRCSPTTNAIVSNPNTTKFACCTQPPGPASSALTTSATGSYSSSRNNPSTKKVTVNRIGPTSPRDGPCGHHPAAFRDPNGSLPYPHIPLLAHLPPPCPRFPP